METEKQTLTKTGRDEQRGEADGKAGNLARNGEKPWRQGREKRGKARRVKQKAEMTGPGGTKTRDKERAWRRESQRRVAVLSY